jgi:hypothetical protein
LKTIQSNSTCDGFGLSWELVEKCVYFMIRGEKIYTIIGVSKGRLASKNFVVMGIF